MKALLRGNNLKVLTAALLFIPAVFAVVLHGRDAWRGVTWNVTGYDLSPKELICRFFRNCKIEKLPGSINLGIYDPHKNFSDLNFIAIEHFFRDWNVLDGLDADLRYSSTHRRWPLLSVEPWPKEGADKNALLKDVASGSYDIQIDNLCRLVGTFNQPVFIRWGHEMDVVDGRYPWGVANSSVYIAAYRHFVGRCRLSAGNVYYVWSPAGNKELVNYWPGREYADYVGLSVYGFPKWDKDHFAKVRSFEDIFREKYARVVVFSRPVMVAELGVTGGESHQIDWLNEGFRRLSDYPLLKSIVYFNSPDNPNVWGKNYGTPDWSLNAGSFE